MCVCVRISVCVCVSVCLCACVSVCLSACLPAWLAGCLSVCLSVCLCVCVFMCLCVGRETVLLGLEKMLCRGIGLVLILWCLKFRLDVFLGFILGLDPKPHTLNSELFRGRVSKWGCGLPHMHEKGRARCLSVCVCVVAFCFL